MEAKKENQIKRLEIRIKPTVVDKLNKIRTKEKLSQAKLIEKLIETYYSKLFKRGS